MIRWLAPLMLTGCLIPQSMVDHALDLDDDGERPLVVGGSDCDDHDPHVGAFSPEVCGNGVDEDCNGRADDVGVGAITVFLDGDGDGYGDALSPRLACTIGPGTVTIAGDCDDNNRFDHPDAPEDCTDGRDNDCDRITDEADNPARWYPDVDQDGFGNGLATPVESCVPIEGRIPDASDCDDERASAHPGALEIPYDGVDNACDGGDDFDLDNDGFPVDPRFANFPIAEGVYTGQLGIALDCDDLDPAINPDADEVYYDGVDGNCDGADDFDKDGDGFGSAAYGGQDCDDTKLTVNPSRVEIFYDGVDNDCDPTNDDDVDGDGYAAAERGGDDCDDHDPYVWHMCPTCGDNDLDGRRWGCDAYDPQGEDCNDLNPNVWASCATCGDDDGDGRFDGCDAYVRISKDCDDTNPYAWSSCTSCTDHDADGHYGVCDRSNGASLDCDDGLANAWLTCATCMDVDGDGYGVGTCDGPADCDDTDPNSATACGACLDLDEDGSFSGCDRYDTVVEDCDDGDPDRGGATAEILEDGIDQDCDGEDLTVDEAHGVFVTPTGVDDEWCGTRAWPCATLSKAGLQARDRDVVVFASADSFEAAWIYASVYGGFNSHDWSRLPESRTTAILKTAGSMNIVGESIIVDAFDVHPSAGWTGLALLRIVSPNVTLSNSSVAGTSLVGACEGVLILSSVTRLHNVMASVTCPTSATGIELERFDYRHDVGKAWLTATSATGISNRQGTTIGIKFSGSEFRAQNLLVETVGSSFSIGVELIGVGSTNRIAAVHDSEIASSSLEPVSQSVAVSAANFDSFSAASSRATSTSAGSSIGVELAPAAGGSVDMNSSVVTSDGSTGAAAITVGHTSSPTSASFTFATLITYSNTWSIALDADGTTAMQVINTVVRSSHVGIHTAGVLDLHGVYLDAPCALGDRSICDASTTEQVNACTWYSCGSAEACAVGDAQLGGPGVDPWVPSATSPLIDAGVDASGWTTGADVDLYGSPRPRGAAYDIGAVEVR